MPLGDVLDLRKSLGILGFGTQDELILQCLNPADPGGKPNHTVGSGVGDVEPVLEVLAELPEVASRERRRNQGLRMHHDHLPQIRSIVRAAVSSAAAIASTSVSLSGPREVRSRSASFRFSIARTRGGACVLARDASASARRAMTASTAGFSASRTAAPASVIA